MANISKLKRDKMLAFLKELKKTHNDDESIRAFNEIENSLCEKKYGLVFEEHTEEVDERLQNEIPVLCEDKERRICKDETLPWNFIIEGDNLQALYLLEKTHKGKIDCIYIDPPYNTGNEDFIYNDNYVDKNDMYRHSKWLSFMEKRLKIAYKLLSDTGFIFISIDDKESATLRLLCDSIFGEWNYEKTDYIQVRYLEKTLKSDMKYHKEIEQVLIYKKSDKAIPYIKPLDYDYNKFIYSIEELSPGEEIELGGKKVIIFQQDEYRIIKHASGFKDGLKEIWATGTILNGNSSGRFFRDYIDGRKDIDGLGVLYKVYDIGDDKYDYRYFTGPRQQKATKGKYYQGVPLEKIEDNAKKFVPIPNFFDMAADFGNIRHEGGVPFNSGKKPVKMIRRFIDYFKRTDITVLDFFAGSGTTAEAVLNANAEDKGIRKFIICTDNSVPEKDRINFLVERDLISSPPNKKSNDYIEWKKAYTQFIRSFQYKSLKSSEAFTQLGICRTKTFPRVKTVITGVKEDGTKYSDGRKANLKFFKCSWTNRKPEDYLLSNALCLHIKEMIELQTGREVDGVKQVLILNKDDYNKTVLNPDIYEKIETVWLNQNMVLSSEELEPLKAKGFKYIPREYFGHELREVAE